MCGAAQAGPIVRKGGAGKEAHTDLSDLLIFPFTNEFGLEKNTKGQALRVRV